MTWRCRRFRFTCPCSRCHSPRLRMPPLSSRTVGFPESGWRSTLSQSTFPRVRRFKSSPTYTHRTRGWSHCSIRAQLLSLTLWFRLGVLQSAHDVPVLTESSFALPRRYLSKRRVNRYVDRRYSAFIATTNSCARPSCSATFRLQLIVAVFAACCEPLLHQGRSRRYLCESFLGCLDPYPGG